MWINALKKLLWLLVVAFNMFRDSRSFKLSSIDFKDRLMYRFSQGVMESLWLINICQLVYINKTVRVMYHLLSPDQWKCWPMQKICLQNIHRFEISCELCWITYISHSQKKDTILKFVVRLCWIAYISHSLKEETFKGLLAWGDHAEKCNFILYIQSFQFPPPDSLNSNKRKL